MDHRSRRRRLPGADVQRGTASPGGVNRGWYRNRDVDALFDRARGEPDPDRRTALYREAADGIAADAPWVFLYQDRLPRLLSRKVDGVVPAASVYIDYTTIRRR